MPKRFVYSHAFLVRIVRHLDNLILYRTADAHCHPKKDSHTHGYILSLMESWIFSPYQVAS
jgi:hypothetical protein